MKGTSPLESILHAVANKWRRLGVASRMQATRADIQALDACVRGVMPREFVEYLECVNGMGESKMDNDLFGFWSVSRIILESASRKNLELLAFADWSIECHRYVISTRSSDSGAVFIEHSDLEFCAPSFKEFLAAYLDEPSLVLPRAQSS